MTNFVIKKTTCGLERMFTGVAGEGFMPRRTFITE